MLPENLEQAGDYRSEHRGLEGPELGVDDAALTIQDHCKGQASETIAERLRDVHDLVAADQRRVVQVELFHKLNDVIPLIDGDAYKLQSFRPKFMLSPNEFRHLFSTWRAPSRPEIHHHDLASPLCQRLGYTINVRKRQCQQGRSVGRLAVPKRDPKPRGQSQHPGYSEQERVTKAWCHGQRELALTP